VRARGAAAARAFARLRACVCGRRVGRARAARRAPLAAAAAAAAAAPAPGRGVRPPRASGEPSSSEPAARSSRAGSLCLPSSRL